GRLRSWNGRQLAASSAARSAATSAAPKTTRFRVATYTRSRSTPARAILRVRSARTPGRSSTSTTTTSRSRLTARWEMASECRAASAWGTRMWSSARSPGPTQVAAAMLTPASLIAAATWASAPGVFSMSMTRSTGMRSGGRPEGRAEPPRQLPGPVGAPPARPRVRPDRPRVPAQRAVLLAHHRLELPPVLAAGIPRGPVDPAPVPREPAARVGVDVLAVVVVEQLPLEGDLRAGIRSRAADLASDDDRTRHPRRSI